MWYLAYFDQGDSNKFVRILFKSLPEVFDYIMAGDQSLEYSIKFLEVK